MPEAQVTALLEEEESAARWVPDVRLLVALPSWREVFFENLRDLISPPQLPELHLQSAPAPFWHDVFVERRLPWRRFLESGGYHVIAIAALLGLARYLPSPPQPVPRTEFDHNQVIYYQAAEYLPPLDTRRADTAEPRKTDPALSRQPIISLPREADNRSQTIVSLLDIKLKNDVPLPNIVSWNDKPKMPLAPAPLVPASNIQRIAPRMENSVIAPAPDTHIDRRRDAMTVQTSIVAPPPDVQTSAKTFQAPQAAVIAPPPSVETESVRRVGDINVAPSAIIAPAPQLPVSAQRTMPGAASAAAAAPRVVPPPPSVGGAASGGTGSRMIALNVHPTVGAPPDSAPGNRRGAFAASPDGHAGASGTPGANGNGTGSGKGSGAAHTGDLPAGLYVGKVANQPANNTGAVAGNPSAKSPNAANSTVAVNTPPTRVTASAHLLQPESASTLSEPEREVFADRKFYAMRLNMPNLNSAGGTWVVRFAELKKSASESGQISAPAATHKVDPPYPIELMRQNVQGTVILYAVIHSDGTVGNVRVLRSVDDRLDRYASQAVAKWQFQPAMKDGVAVDVEATFHIPFKPARTNF